MTDEQRKRIHDITYSTDDRMELAERIVALEEENEKLRKVVTKMRPICIQGKRCTFADKLYILKAMEELGIEVEDA